MPKRAVIISPYDLGRQPFALAHLSAWLTDAGVHCSCLDLSQQRINAADVRDADLIAIHLGMHTATRIAVALLPDLRAAAPEATIVAWGLYGPMNAEMFGELGADHVFGGEAEAAITSLLVGGEGAARPAFRTPKRDGLPELERYASLSLPDGATRTVGFAQSTRGCKHTCRHCPVVPVYEGRFRALPADIVMADIRQQIAAGAQHISFGDPDFLNGPTHALRIARRMADEHGGITWDFIAKVEHLLAHRERLDELVECGALFVTSAVESVDDSVLCHLHKGHTAADFVKAVAAVRGANLALVPTFIPFTPWTTRNGYVALLRALVELDLQLAVAPVQLIIRLLVPRGSWLLRDANVARHFGKFDPAGLGHPWANTDPVVDRLQAELQAWVGEHPNSARAEVFATVWAKAHEAAGRRAPPVPPSSAGQPPTMSEPWYCCAEPTAQQMAGATGYFEAL